jgi:hypothetical protein
MSENEFTERLPCGKFSGCETDCIFLFAIILVSSLPYLSGLGFYSDDWSYQSELSISRSKPIMEALSQVWSSDRGSVRPIMVAYLVLTYRAFGSNTLAYQIANVILLASMGISLYLLLRELELRRWLSVSVASVFSFLPQYSTDRFWWASAQALYCMSFGFLGIIALSRTFQPHSQRRKEWLVLASALIVASVLSYEVSLGMIVVSIAMIGWREHLRHHGSPVRWLPRFNWLLAPLSVLFLVGIIKTLMQTRMTVHSKLLPFVSHPLDLIWKMCLQAFQFCIWIYGLKMPLILSNLFRQSALGWFSISISIAIGLMVATFLWKCIEISGIPRRRDYIAITVMGFILFIAGYALFSHREESFFLTAGIHNRVTIASAVGAAMILVGISGLICSFLRPASIGKMAFSLAIGLICGTNCLAIEGIAYFWRDASLKQTEILHSLSNDVHGLPSGSILLLDGFCRFSGPGVVFETNWDATGAIRLTLNDISLAGDVVSPDMHFMRSSIETTFYGEKEKEYFYGDHLYVYNVRARRLFALRSSSDADSYLHSFNSTGDSGCPLSKEGYGTEVF